MVLQVRRIRKSTTKQTQQAAQQALSELLANSRGLPMKIGQVLAGMDDSNAYNKLTHSVQPWPLKRIQPVLELAWQKPIKYTLLDIQESQAAASLGQVHQARLNERETVAIKVQYPDIAKAIDAEMKIAGFIPAAGPVKTWLFDMQAYKTTLRDTLQDELDYLHEMQQQMYFKGNIHVAGLKVPHIFPILCRPNILVQEWVEGERLSACTAWPQEARLYIARTLMQSMFQSLFQLGLVHGDPHPGNMLFQFHPLEPQSILLDFGCMVNIEATRRIALLKLILYARGECITSPLDCFVALGFDADKLIHIQAQLPQLVQLLFQPFTEDEAFDTHTWQLSDAVATILGDERWWFRSAAPADLFLLIRIFQGLITQLETLQVTLPWWPLLKQCIDQETIDISLDWQPDQPIPSASPQYYGSAKELKIHIQRPNKEPMKISLTAESALHLEDLMPEHVLQHIQDADINLSTIRKQLLKEGLEPQVLIDLQTNEYHYHLQLVA